MLGVWIGKIDLKYSGPKRCLHKRLLSISTCVVWLIGLCHAITCLQAYADGEGPDQPAHSRSLIRAFTDRLQNRCIITKTCLYNVDPLKPHFYIIKLGFPEVYIIFLISFKNTDCGYSLELPRRDGSNEYPQSMF